MTIALAADHAGYEQLKQLQSWLESSGHSCRYFGPAALNPEDDYPDFVRPAAKAVSRGECERAIVIGGSGQGEAMAANRIKGVRCAVVYGPSVAKKVVDAEGRVSRDPYEVIRLSRQHNNSNALSLAARFITDQEMKNIVKIWLEEPFSNEQRHNRRISKLDEGL